MKPKLRSCEAADIAGARRLLGECGLPHVDLEGQFPESFVVAEYEGELIGVAGIERHGNHGLLRSVAVSRNNRGRGVGALLVRECLDRARSQGIVEVYLLTLDAQKYFESFDFAVVSRDQAPHEIAKSSEFKSVCPTSATMMVLRAAVNAD